MTPQLDPRLETYVRKVRSTIAEDPACHRWPEEIIGRPTVDRIQELARELVAEPLDLAPEQRALPEEGYGRHLLYADDEYGFVVLAMCWPAGIQGSTHDHGTWGVVAVAEGNVVIENYERRDDGSDPSVCELRAHDVLAGHPGDVGYVLPPEIDFHKVGNACDENPAITIHTYGYDIRECNYLCPETGVLKQVKLGND
ncbi:MAG: cysteine dioxygenase family protein [Planctomycetota bacterium]|nr:cysteine dioxygenase family protein [Planctomycetota bacterium]